MKNIFKYLIFSLGILVALPLCYTGISFFYNYNIHPLAKLYKNIAIGDDFDEVKNHFEEYYQNRKDVQSLHYTFKENDSCDFMIPYRAAVKKCLFLSDTSFADDVQLTVVFGEYGKVIDMLYAGD